MLCLRSRSSFKRLFLLCFFTVGSIAEDNLGFDSLQQDFMAAAVQCFDGPLAKLPFALQSYDVDPAPILFQVLKNYCDAGQVVTFESALRDYKECSGTDLESFYETIWSALAGATMMCAEYVYNFGQKLQKCQEKLDNEGVYYFDPLSDCVEYPLPRIPDECVNTVLGDNPVGNFLKYDLTHEVKNLECLAVLSHRLPLCTLRRWPVPIPGDIFKFGTCFASKMKNIALMACNQELQVMSECLPSLGELTESDADETICKGWIKQCTTDRLQNKKLPVWRMMLPPPLSAIPINDICQTTEVEANLQEVAGHFEAFHTACESKEDIEFWKAKKPTSPDPFITKSIEVSAVNEVIVDQVSAPEDENSSSLSSSSGTKSSSSSSGRTVFIIGLLSGVIIAFGALVYIGRKKRTIIDPPAAVPRGGILGNRFSHQYRPPTDNDNSIMGGASMSNNAFA